MIKFDRKINAVPRWLCGVHTSPKVGRVYYRSSYELRVYRVLDLDDDVEYYEIEPYEIEYVYEDKTHRYIPDIVVRYADGSYKVLEVKPERFLSDKKVKAKLCAGKDCFGDNFVVVTEKEIKHMEHSYLEILRNIPIPRNAKRNKFLKYKKSVNEMTDDEKKLYWHNRSKTREAGMSLHAKSERSRKGWDKKDNKEIGDKIRFAHMSKTIEDRSANASKGAISRGFKLLAEDEIFEVRQLYFISEYTMEDISCIYRVHRSQISSAIRGVGRFSYIFGM